MTKSEALQIKYLLQEVEMYKRQLEQIDRAIEDTKVFDTVKGSTALFPYARQTFLISGTQNPEEYSKLRNQQEELRKQLELKEKRCKEEYDALRKKIDNVPDSYMRQLLTYRFLEGRSWVEAAMRVGGNNTPDGVRMAVSRFFASHG